MGRACDRRNGIGWACGISDRGLCGCDRARRRLSVICLVARNECGAHKNSGDSLHSNKTILNVDVRCRFPIICCSFSITVVDSSPTLSGCMSDAVGMIEKRHFGDTN